MECFVSYKREDDTRVRTIVQGLREAGLNVWWDRDIPGGHPWRETIVEYLDSARCVVVCWTSASTGPEGAYVREEAERAKARGVLLPVLLDPVALPLGFGELQALDLIGWTGRSADSRWQHFVATARAIATGKPRPKPPLGRIRRWGEIGATVGIVLAALGFVNDVLGLRGALCYTDSVRGICRSLGLVDGPSPVEERAWAMAKRGPDGDGYRHYLNTYPQGAYAQQAHRRLAACRKLVELHWLARDHSLPLVVLPVLRAAASESAAREQALPRVLSEAKDTVCGIYSQTETHKLRGVRLDEAGWQCESALSGWRCRYDGKAICEIDERSTTEREVCGAMETGAGG